MSHGLQIFAVRVVIVLVFGLGVLGQTVVVPLVARNAVRQFPEAAGLRIPGTLACIALVLCVQAALVCLWRLLSMVAEGDVFRRAALRWVTAVIACAWVATAICAASLVVLAAARALPPAVFLLLACGVIGGTGVALLVLVMRGLLLTATGLADELTEVI